MTTADTTPTSLDLDAVAADIKQAHDEICNIAEGKRRWTMSIPAKEATDSDLVISRALAGAERALSELAKLTRQRDEAFGLLYGVTQFGVSKNTRAAISALLARQDAAPATKPQAEVCVCGPKEYCHLDNCQGVDGPLIPCPAAECKFRCDSLAEMDDHARTCSGGRAA